MKSKRAEYDVQPAYNESVLPPCPPSYCEAVASSARQAPSTYQLPYHVEPYTGPVISQAPQVPKEPYRGPVISQAPQVPKEPYRGPVISQAPQVPTVFSNVTIPPYQSPIMTLPVAVGPKSVRVRCPYCHAHVLTKTTTSVKRSAHYSCCLLFFCGCFLCSCIPYCLASFKNVNHTCPTCNSFIGTYRP